MNTFTYGQKTITYSLERAERKTLAITVKPDMSVCVRAPHTADVVAIDKVLRKRAAWVLHQQRFFSQFLPRTTPRQYVSGETYLYLGRQYRLRVRDAETEEVKLIGGFLYVSTPGPSDPDRVKKLLEEWYETHAQDRLRERFEASLQSISGWHVTPPELRLMRMTRQWGKCSSIGVVIVNVDLIRAPRACIDYVIMHELCHLQHPHHKADYYKLLTNMMPDWQERKKRLELLLA